MLNGQLAALADRALLWGYGRERHQSASASAEQLANLRDSIQSAYVVVHNAAFVLLHDGALNCSSIKIFESLRCKEEHRPFDEVAVRTGRCELGSSVLERKRMYLVRINASEYDLEQVHEELFSYKRDDTITPKQKARIWKKPDRKVLANQTSRIGPYGKAPFRYGESLGIGAWLRYLAHFVLLPVGIKQALYLDADTCVIRPEVVDIFTIDESVPLVVSRRAVPTWKLRFWLDEKFTDLQVARKLFGFMAPWGPSRNNTDEIHMFNNGVMMMNLLPYCVADIWGRMRNLTHHHATMSRIFGPLDRVKELGDNQVIELVGGIYSRMVGTEWNCRHYSSMKTLRSQKGAPCRIRHLHEKEASKLAKGGHTCRQITLGNLKGHDKSNHTMGLMRNHTGIHRNLPGDRSLTLL
jgi:hypothetical protein|eukprot:jgi/Chrpa1/2097/Chrysochromulina_OHIO_Genome00016837-RA